MSDQLTMPGENGFQLVKMSIIFYISEISKFGVLEVEG